jgi:hypothetical protein
MLEGLSRGGSVKPFSRVVVVLALGFAAVSCSERQCLALPCPFQFAVTLDVRDAVDGGPVTDPVANGLPCGSSGVCTPMKADGGVIGAGTSTIDVTAPGYGHVQLDVTVPSAAQDPCSCQPDYVPQTRDVSLPPS